MKSHNAFYILLTVVSLLFVSLIIDFILPIFWAIVLTTLFAPVYKYLNLKLRKPFIASLTTILLIFLIVLIPGFFILAAVTDEAIIIIKAIESGDINLEQLLLTLTQFSPKISEWLTTLGLDINQITKQVSTIVTGTGQYAISLIMSIGQNILRFSLLFFIMIYLLFFFLKDGSRIVIKCIKVFPLDDNQERFLLEKFSSVTKATVKGTIIVGIVQGLIGGVIFMLLDIQAAVLWGVMMTFLSIIPGIGTAIIWFPAVCIFLINGAFLKAILLLLSGIFIIGLVDNFLRPYLVGKETKLPDYLILLTTLGGVSLVGLSGFVIGPIVAALFIALWSLLEYTTNQ
jgi:predicted PurR-regulated permease PerM